RQSFTVFRKRPCVIGTSNEQRRNVNARGVPQRPACGLIEGVLQNAIGSPQARWVTRVAARIGRHALGPEGHGNRSIPVFVLVLERNLSVPSSRVRCFRSEPISSQRKVEFVRLALVL